VDWFDPNTWKPLAQLISSWQAIIGGIIVFVGYITGFFRWVFTRLGLFQSRTKNKVLSFAQNDAFCFWGVGKLNDQSEPVTLVSGRWRVTNSSDRDVKITNVRLSKYAVHQSVQLTMRNPEDERNIFVHGGFPIAPHQTLEVELLLTFFPPVGRAPEPIISDVIFTDNFENQYSVRSKFTYGSRPAPKWSRWLRRQTDAAFASAATTCSRPAFA
jgi:hypothetical protein